MASVAWASSAHHSHLANITLDNEVEVVVLVVQLKDNLAAAKRVYDLPDVFFFPHFYAVHLHYRPLEAKTGALIVSLHPQEFELIELHEVAFTHRNLGRHEDLERSRVPCTALPLQALGLLLSFENRIMALLAVHISRIDLILVLGLAP